MSTFYTNKMTIQVGDAVRLIFHDERAGMPPQEHPIVTTTVGDAVMTIANARQLRDLLVQHVKDDPTPGEIERINAAAQVRA